MNKDTRKFQSVSSDRCLLAFALVGCFFAYAALSVQAATFEVQRKALQSSLVTQPESSIVSFLTTGLDEGQPAVAFSDAQQWLRQNTPKDPATYYTAARAAELGGSRKEAIVLYQQFLKQVDLKSELADEAVYAVYSLLNVLKDSSGAYTFSKGEGDRLLVCPRAKQFDTWFLDEAIRNKDVESVARRLAACAAAGYPEELLTTRYNSYFLWLQKGEGQDKAKELQAKYPIFARLAKVGGAPVDLKQLDDKLTKEICSGLLSLGKDADVATTVAALDAVITGARKAPIRITIQGIDNLAQVKEEVFTDPKVISRILEITDGLRYSERGERLRFVDRLFEYVKRNTAKEPLLPYRTAVCLWQYAASGEYARQYGKMQDFTTELLDKNPAVAYSLARCGVDILSLGGKIPDARRSRDISSVVPEVKALASRAAIKLGLVLIPVPPTDPTYPIFKSQAEWLVGNEEGAWVLLDESWEQLLPAHRRLSVDYVMWALSRVIFSRNESRMEALSKALKTWADEANALWSLNQKLELDIAYGDMALQLDQLLNAQKFFEIVAKNPIYARMPERHKATLRLVKVKRLAKNYDAAIEILDKLDMEGISELWAGSKFARAEVFYDGEDYDKAADVIAAILSRDSYNSDAIILSGMIHNKRQHFMNSTELDIGPREMKDTLIIGDNLKVTMHDPTLEFSGGGLETEVVVWAISGDKEQFFLGRFGDSKIKFRGEIKTALGAPNPGDRVLQVIGSDEIYFGYSDRFLKKMINLKQKTGGPIFVRSDALLMASARKLLSPEEQRVVDMEASLNKRVRGHSPDERLAGSVERNARMTAEEREEAVAATLQEQAQELSWGVLKPGMPISIRVIDPNSSMTPNRDEVVASLSSSSGDSLSAVVLKETGTHTGWFEGSVQTSKTQAKAFALNSAIGLDPGMVISPKMNYPAWRPVRQKEKVPEFTLFLNDDVSLGKLVITAKEQGSKLTKFALQCGMTEKTTQVVAVYPDKDLVVSKPWHPSVTVMNDTDENYKYSKRTAFNIAELETHLQTGWLHQKHANGFAENVSGPSVALSKELKTKVDSKWNGPDNVRHVLYRFRGYFYEPQAVTRRFKVELGDYKIPWMGSKRTHLMTPPQFMLAVDGRLITNNQKSDQLEGSAQLRSGVHRFEIWAAGYTSAIGFERSLKLLTNLGNAQTLQPCPDSFFNPNSLPKSFQDKFCSGATMTANSDGSRFEVSFAPGTLARVINLVLMNQEGDVPALNKIELTDSNGKRVLPVEGDFAALNSDDKLQIQSGDRITVRYVDNRPVGKEKKIYERMLRVAYRDGAIGFFANEADVRCNRKAGGIQNDLLRFSYNKPLAVAVCDWDMDTTDAPDTVEVVLETRRGGQKKFLAKEKNKSSEFFCFSIVPVLGVPKTENEFQVAEGEVIVATYRDIENTGPSPVNRSTSLPPAIYSEPKLRMTSARVTPIDYKTLDRKAWPEKSNLTIGFASLVEQTLEAKEKSVEGLGQVKKPVPVVGDQILPQWAITNAWVDVANPPSGGIDVVHGQKVGFEVEAPHLALTADSTVKVYVQTDTGREQAKLLKESLATTGGEARAVPPPFDITVPGTLQLGAKLIHHPYNGDPRPSVASLNIYTGGSISRSDGVGLDDLCRNFFSCRIPLIAGFLPSYGVLNNKEIELLQKKGTYLAQGGLIVRSGEKIHVGYRYTDANGVERWITGSATVVSHPVLDVMGVGTQEEKSNAFIGESLQVRVVDLGADISDQGDSVKVVVQSKSGSKHQLDLLEVDKHSGVFKGALELSYAKMQGTLTNEIPFTIERDGFPVVYGDRIVVAYADALKQKAVPKLVQISKGANGEVALFSKKYTDTEIGVRTQFSLAESYLEMAKRHRAVGELKAAANEYALAKEMLEKSMEIFSDSASRAQAEYLLANLTQEEADATQGDPELRESRYRAALARYLRVTGNYSDTMFAPKAQFKIATVYEQLNQHDIAAEEYVKLAYKYTDSELLAVAMARLGKYFKQKAATYEEKAKPLLEKKDDKDAQFEGKAMSQMAVREYLKSADIFYRLLERFPDHELAGVGGLMAGQSFMRAGDNQKAFKVFKQVFENDAYDGPKIRAEAMYWAGMSSENLRDQMGAYSIYMKLTFDFPETKWASYARGRLSDEGMLRVGKAVEAR